MCDLKLITTRVSCKRGTTHVQKHWFQNKVMWAKVKQRCALNVPSLGKLDLERPSFLGEGH